jgi:hypothetical protein
MRDPAGESQSKAVSLRDCGESRDSLEAIVLLVLVLSLLPLNRFTWLADGADRGNPHERISYQFRRSCRNRARGQEAGVCPGGIATFRTFFAR